MMPHRLTQATSWLALLLTAALVQSPHLWFEVGAPNMDFIAHLLWVDQMGASLANLELYPRWVHASNYGLGSPALLYYAPGYFYGVALLNLLIDDIWVSIRIFELAASLLTGAFALALFRSHGVARLSATLGAMALQLAPVPFLIALHFSGLPWATSFAALTALGYALLRGDRDPESRLDPGVILALAAVILMHTLTGLMALIGFSALGLRHLGLRHIGRGDGRPWNRFGSWLRWWALSVVIALMLAGLHLIPALTSFDLASTVNWTAFYKPDNAFLLPVFTAPVHGMRWPTMQVAVPLLLLPTVLGVFGYLRGQGAEMDAPRRRAITGLLMVSGVALALGSELAYPLWMLDSPLLKVQFPFRFVVVVQLTALLALVLVLDHAIRTHARRAIRIGVALLALHLLIGAGLVVKMDFIEGRPMDVEALRTAPFKGIPEFRPGEAQLSAWLEWLEQGGQAKECALQSLECASIVMPDRATQWEVVNPHATPVPLRLSMFDFPAWTMRRDDAPIAHRSANPSGLIQVEVPPGRHRFRAEWQRLPQEWAGFASSGLGLLIWLGLVWRRRSAFSRR